MREIKFRAWVKPLGKMAQVYTLGLTGIEGTTVNVDGELRGGLDWTTMELMQYTGLKDKNGKEIYERDIVEAKTVSRQISEVKWMSHGYHNGFRLLGLSIGLSEGVIEDFKIKVIGNIYENPELLVTKETK